MATNHSTNSVVLNLVYEAEHTFYPELAVFDGLRVIARVPELNLKPTPKNLLVEVENFRDPRIPGGIPAKDLQGRIEAMVWDKLVDWANFEKITVTYGNEAVKR